MSEAYAVQFMTEEEKAAIATASQPQERQALHNRPREGFAHNCYNGGLGMFFQKTVKNGIIEKLLDQAWQGMVKYRTAGNKKAFRAGLREPEKVFVYDDELFTLLDAAVKEAADEWCTDNDGPRKQELVRKATDIVLTIAFEDVYYRGLMKRALDRIVLHLVENPHLLDLSPKEDEIEAVFCRYRDHSMKRSKRKAEWFRWLKAREENND